MKVSKKVLISIVLFFALSLAQFATPAVVFASGTVGSGTPGSCTEAALDTALAGGGAVDFDCGAAPHTITITGTKVIASNTQIDGGGLITISGGDAVQVFSVDAGVTFTITGLTVSHADYTGNGGGMYIDAGATVTVTDSTFKDNNVVDGYGGAIYVNAATLNVSNSSFITNNADVTSIGSLSLGGGAIQNNDGTIEILGSTFNGNSVTSPSADGGAIYNGDFDGGPGIPDANPDVMEIGNSTFYGNTLVGDEGTSGSSGGAIRSNGDITLAHNTFSDNDSGVTTGSGDESGAVTFGHGTVVMAYNIFANSTSFSGTPYDCAKRVTVGSFTSVGNLVESDFSCAGSYSSDPLLGPLQDNGGPTLTMQPGTGSQAIHNAGSCASGITTDQRGVSRPQPGGVTNCDIGAVEVDTDAPTTTITKAAGQDDPANSSPVNFKVTFSEPVVGFTPDDLNLSASTVGGAPVGAITGGPTIFNVAISGMTTPGDIVLSIDENALTDIALNGNDASTSPDNTVAYDATGPAVTVEQAAGQEDPTNDATINFTVVFDESVTGFNEADVTIGGTANPDTKDVTGSGTTYNIAVSGMSSDGTVTASVNAGAVNDSLGNPSSASTSSDNVVNYDATGPNVTINQKSGQSDPTNTLPIEFTVVFTESVTGFTDSDVSVSGTAGASTATVTGSGTTYNVAVADTTQDGTVIATILAGVATDAVGNSNAASTSTDNQVTYDVDNPSVTINQAVGQADPTGISPANFTVVFSKPVIGFQTGDVTLTGTSGATTATVTEIAPNDGTTYNVAVSGMTTNGTAIVSIEADVAEDSASNGNLPSSSTDNTVTFAFVTPGVPTLTAPASGAVVSGLTPLLNWNNSNPAAQYYQIQVSTVSNFASTVISQSNIAISEITPSSDLNPGVLHYWRVRAFNAIDQGSNWSSVRSFKTPLQTPVLASPIGGIVLDIDRPTFDWGDVPGAASYTLQISTVSNFKTGLITKTAPGSQYVMPTDLAQNKVYFWRVSAKTPAVISAWSAVQSFKTGNPPTVPVLATPAQNALVTILNPLFNWGNSTLPMPTNSTTFEYYQIQVADNTAFNTPVIDKQITGLTSSQYQSVLLDGLVVDKKYYWRVRAVNDFGGIDQFSAWSPVRTFRSAMEKPVLVAPANTTTPTLVTRQPSFDWQDTAGATGYQISISRYANMSSPLATVSTVTSNYLRKTDLPANTTLFWRVRATGPNGPSLWSAIWTFKTGNPPTVPTLVSPANNALTTNFFPIFDWSTSTLPAGTFKHYELEVDNDNAFGSPAIHEFITVRVDSRYLTQPADVLDPNTTYYWRVRAVSTISAVDHFSGWSAVRKLRMALTPPTLVLPADGAVITTQPIFDWDEIIGATGYTVQVSTSATFGTLLVNTTIAGGSNTSYDPALNLPLNKTLYWRVRANGTNTSAWTVFDFKIVP